jgi:hypothetical protein
MSAAAGREGRCNTGIYSVVVFGPRMRGRTENWARRPGEARVRSCDCYSVVLPRSAVKEGTMESVHGTVAGLDVHKEDSSG